MAYVAKRNPDRCPTHPGALLREDMIPAVQKSVAEIAGLLGISRQHLYDILAEKKPVSPNVAVLLGKLFGDGASIWVRMQGAYDTWHAARETDVRGIPTLKGGKGNREKAPESSGFRRQRLGQTRAVVRKMRSASQTLARGGGGRTDGRSPEAARPR